MGLDIYIETQPKNDLNNEASRKQVGGNDSNLLIMFY
ncbi:hypothetical protein AE77_05126, partial [Klebsiella pneumoniae CHS 21]